MVYYILRILVMVLLFSVLMMVLLFFPKGHWTLQWKGAWTCILHGLGPQNSQAFEGSGYFGLVLRCFFLVLLSFLLWYIVDSELRTLPHPCEKQLHSPETIGGSNRWSLQMDPIPKRLFTPGIWSWMDPRNRLLTFFRNNFRLPKTNVFNM